jgi:HD-GYP domain-containing protein (c-di-GMP phosphodiesterase class II)
MAGNEQKFIPVRIGTLRSDQKVSFDIFVQIAGKQVHYLRDKDIFDQDRLKRLKAKGVKKLWIVEETEPLYLTYLEEGLNELNNSKIEIGERADIARDSMVSDAENAIKNVETEQGYKSTENRVGKVVDFLMSDQGALKSILASAGCATDNFAHSANVASVAVSLAAKLGITNSKSQIDLGLACLLHDIGKTHLGISELSDYPALSVADQKKYAEHPQAGATLLAGKPYINKTILEMIANHEEVGEGAGYPNKKRLAALPLESQILNLCNDYDHYATLKKIPPMEAIKPYFSDKLGLFDLNHIKVLKTILAQ